MHTTIATPQDMPYKDIDDGHRIGLTEEGVISHTKHIFEQGLQLEAILLAHEYIEQKLNTLYKQAVPAEPQTIHRKFKQVIDLLRSKSLLTDQNYVLLNDFNRLRNINSNHILDFSHTIRGAKKGDMVKAMNLAEECERIVVKLLQDIIVKNNNNDNNQKSRKGNKKKRKEI
jgi:hypothetical protein